MKETGNDNLLHEYYDNLLHYQWGILVTSNRESEEDWERALKVSRLMFTAIAPPLF